MKTSDADDDPGSANVSHDLHTLPTFTKSIPKRTPQVSLNAGCGCFFFQLLDFGVDGTMEKLKKFGGVLVTITMMNGH